VQLQQIKGRINRLEKLSRGLVLEAMLLKEGNDPLLHRERRAYLKAIQGALASLELARVALAGAVRRIEGA
jgi:hypothetical protein